MGGIPGPTCTGCRHGKLKQHCPECNACEHGKKTTCMHALQRLSTWKDEATLWADFKISQDDQNLECCVVIPYLGFIIRTTTNTNTMGAGIFKEGVTESWD